MNNILAKQPNVLEVFSKLVSTLAEVRFKETISHVDGLEFPWEEYVDLAFALHDSFTKRLTVGNPFINEQISFAFTKQLLFEADSLALLSIKYLNPGINEKIDIAREDWNKHREEFQKKTAFLKSSYFSEADKELFGLYHQELRVAHNKFTSVLAGAAKTLEGYFETLFYHLIAKLLTLHGKCESPLERAFIIGLAAHKEASYLWLPYLSSIEAQLQVKNYRIDFAVQHKEENYKLAVELDGHTYHEKTEDQAVHDRRRDRELLEEGWAVMRFHRKEIEEDLLKCTGQVLRAIEAGNDFGLR